MIKLQMDLESWCAHDHRNHDHDLHHGDHHQVDLEWRCGQYTQVGNTAGHIVLQVNFQTESNHEEENIALAWQDLDITSKVEANGWRKVNTVIIIVIIATIHRRHHRDVGEQPGPLRGEGESPGQPCAKAD